MKIAVTVCTMPGCRWEGGVELAADCKSHLHDVGQLHYIGRGFHRSRLCVPHNNRASLW